MALSTYILGRSEKIDEKTGVLQAAVLEGEHSLANLGGLTLTHDPSIKLLSVNAKRCFIFKSAVMPLKLTFESQQYPVGWKEGDKLADPADYSIVFKNGDDLRSDQLVLSMIALMDLFFKKENLDF